MRRPGFIAGMHGSRAPSSRTPKIHVPLRMRLIAHWDLHRFDYLWSIVAALLIYLISRMPA